MKTDGGFFFHFVLYWGIHYLEKKVARNYKQQNKYFDNFHIIKIRQNLNHFAGGHFIKHKLFISGVIYAFFREINFMKIS